MFLVFSYGINADRYMAPEVFKHRKYDKKVDVFSFAMILFEVISVSNKNVIKGYKANNISLDHDVLNVVIDA